MAFAIVCQEERLEPVVEESVSDHLVRNVLRSLSKRGDDSSSPVRSADLNSWLPDIGCSVLESVR